MFESAARRREAAERVVKLLMIGGARRVPLDVVDGFQFDLGLPHNYVLTLLSEFPEYFQVCGMHLEESLPVSIERKGEMRKGPSQSNNFIFLFFSPFLTKSLNPNEQAPLD